MFSRKLPPKIQTQFDKRLSLFEQNQNHPILNIHSLKGQYTGHSSMNITADYRALFYKDGDTIIIFAFIGTHSELY